LYVIPACSGTTTRNEAGCYSGVGWARFAVPTENEYKLPPASTRDSRAGGRTAPVCRNGRVHERKGEMKDCVVVVVLVLAVCLGAGSAERVGAFGAAREEEGLSGSNHGVAPIEVAQAGLSGTGAGFKEVAAIIQKYQCTVCHIGAEPRDGLRLDSYDNIMKGSEDGPVVVPGAPEKSELVLRVNGSKEPRMPMAGPPWLNDQELKTLESWVKTGAKGPQS